MIRALLALLLVAASGCAPSFVARVAAYGDSVTWGYGGKPGGWVGELEDMTGDPIANLAVPGETADEGADRIDGPFGLMLAPQAEVVLVLHGGNDMNQAFHRAPCNRRCDPDEVQWRFDEIAHELRRIRDVAARNDRRVVFATYWPPSPDACSRYDAEEFATFQAFVTRMGETLIQVADEYGDPVVRLDDLTDLPTDADNYYDCLHPSGRGYRRIAERWLEDEDLWRPSRSGVAYD